MKDVDGWNYFVPGRNGQEVGDGRKLCTIDHDGMTFVGIRHWSAKHWLSNGEPISGETVRAWKELPPPAQGYWQHGLLEGTKIEVCNPICECPNRCKL